MDRTIACQIDHSRDALVVTAAVPGARPEDLHVEFSAEALTIEERSARGTRVCVLPLSVRVDQRRASIHLARGVLSLHLPTIAPSEGSP